MSKKNKKPKYIPSYELNKINHYTLNKDNITPFLLETLGFHEGSFRHLKEEEGDKYTEGWYSWWRYLPGCAEISLNVHININLLDSWDDFDGIDILDEDFGQPYTPFYTILDKQDEPDFEKREEKCGNFIRGVINEYNKVMDSLVEVGLFCRRID